MTACLIPDKQFIKRPCPHYTPTKHLIHCDRYDGVDIPNHANGQNNTDEKGYVELHIRWEHNTAQSYSPVQKSLLIPSTAQPPSGDLNENYEVMRVPEAGQPSESYYIKEGDWGADPLVSADDPSYWGMKLPQVL